jgi:hypothetical protein
VQRLKPRLGERGTPSVIFLPPELLVGPSGGCLSVVVLGPSSTHFTVRPAGDSPLPESVEDWPQASLAGLVQLTRCGARRSRLNVLLIEMRSPRAVLETVAAQSKAPLESAIEVLPQRDPGPIAPLTGFGPRPKPAPASERLARAEANARRDGALDAVRASLQSSSRGNGSSQRELETGCHRFEFFAEGAESEALPYDLSVLPEFDATASLVSVERGDGLGATFSVCAGERTALSFRFSGAPRNARVWLLASRFALPAGLPESWGSGGRARMAAVLRRHNVAVTEMPIDQALGVQGPTLMPIRVEPGACYVAAIAPLEGHAFQVALGAVASGISAQNHGNAPGEGTLLSFCVGKETVATLEADSRGPGLTWLFGMWQLGRRSLGEEP